MGYFADVDIPAVLDLQQPVSKADLERVRQAVEDGHRLYQRIHSKPGVGTATLRREAEQDGIDPDRFTAAIDVLERTGKIVHLPEAASAIVAPEPTPTRATRRSRRRMEAK